MHIDFNNPNIPIIQPKDYWKERSKARLKSAFDTLKEARDFLLHARLLSPEWEGYFQTAGKSMLEIAKELGLTKEELDAKRDEQRRQKMILQEAQDHVQK